MSCHGHLVEAEARNKVLCDLILNDITIDEAEAVHKFLSKYRKRKQ